jgi:hypothetical protein
MGRAIATGDFNGNGRLDVAVVNEQPASQEVLLDADGGADLMTASYEGGTADVLWNTCTPP